MNVIPKGTVVDSPLGMKKVDSDGAPISGVRMDVARAYAGIPGLLQKVINENDVAAWTAILTKIDYIYANLDHSLTGLDKETGFSAEVQSQIRSGKKLLFKPNVVFPEVIDPETHGDGPAAAICTEWPLVAAIMRWFHDKLEITYHQMALGEASASIAFTATAGSSGLGRTITTEALLEGKSADVYFGWGFFFVRKYLFERHPPFHEDDPMEGYEESVAGTFIPPGIAADRLMVYDLNKLHDNTSKGIDVAVPDGANFREITLHKVIVGGDPDSVDDIKDYPGCILVNVPKHKIHAQDLITNAIKNLGIGLYPGQAPSPDGNGKTRWKYSCDPTSVPSIKGQLPHMPWIVEVDDDTNLPVKDKNGEYIASRTAGMSGTQADVIRAVQSRNVFMIHVVDAIDMINICHDPSPAATRVPGRLRLVISGLRGPGSVLRQVLFQDRPHGRGAEAQGKNGWPTEFVHHVPVAKIDGTNIVTEEGLDSPLFRYNLYNYAERRGVGQQKYHVVGWDT